MEKIELRTDYRLEKERRDLAICEEYERLASVPETSKTKIEEYLMRKYGLHSRTTLWTIRKRVAARRAAGEGRS